MRRLVAWVPMLPLLGCARPPAGPAPRPALVDVRPVTADVSPPLAPVVAAPSTTCTIEGAGEPVDRLFYHAEEDLLMFGSRTDAEPLVRIEGDGRYTLSGRWTELAPPGGDGRARLVLDRAGAFRLDGYSPLHATRFRLRRRTALVPDHVWLEPDYLLQVSAADGARAKAVATLPFDAPKERALEVPCSDLAYDDQRELVRDPDTKTARAHIYGVTLHDAPGGALVFEASHQLFFVTIDESRDGFLRIHGERHGVRIAGWTPQALVSKEPQGAGEPGGNRSGRTHRATGKPARVVRTTPLFAERGGKEVTIGQLEPGLAVRIPGSSTAAHVVVELEAREVRAVGGATLRVAEADLEPR